MISKKSFTCGQYLQGSVGQATWAFPLLHVWDLDQRRHLSGPAYSLPSCYFRPRLCLCSLFVLVASESLAKSVTVFSFWKGRPWHPEKPIPGLILVHWDEIWHSSPSLELWTDSAFYFGYRCSIPLNICIRLLGNMCKGGVAVNWKEAGIEPWLEPLASCVTLTQVLNLSEPQSPCLWNEGRHPFYRVVGFTRNVYKWPSMVTLF